MVQSALEKAREGYLNKLQKVLAGIVGEAGMKGLLGPDYRTLARHFMMWLQRHPLTCSDDRLRQSIPRLVCEAFAELRDGAEPKPPKGECSMSRAYLGDMEEIPEILRIGITHFEDRRRAIQDMGHLVQSIAVGMGWGRELHGAIAELEFESYACAEDAVLMQEFHRFVRETYQEGIYPEAAQQRSLKIVFGSVTFWTTWMASNRTIEFTDAKGNSLSFGCEPDDPFCLDAMLTSLEIGTTLSVASRMIHTVSERWKSGAFKITLRENTMFE